MATYAAPIDVKIDAMIEAGITPITAETDPGWRATVANARYEPVVKDVLARHAWKLATATIPLVFMEEREADIWRYAYQEPSTDPEKLINRGVFIADPTSQWSDYLRSRPIRHTINNGVILTNCKPSSTGEGLVLLYGFRATEADWSPRLAAAIVMKLAAVFAGAIKKDAVMAAAKDRKAEDMILRASVTEAEQASRPRAFDDQLVSAWEIGGRRR